ncbi:hypothetical protein [Mycolicibacterium vaccae]|uniref:hypothetical protein n=1 Tax=Mycolicibacterium vaccae TaxID=1810 RepID=UPI003D08AF53
MNSVASPIPTRSQILGWDTTALDNATQRWRLTADASETAFEQHRQNIAAPGGSIWEGDANDAALDRVTSDLVVARRQGDVQRVRPLTSPQEAAGTYKAPDGRCSTPSPRPKPTVFK